LAELTSEDKKRELFVEEGRLRDGGWFATGDANDAQDGDFAEGGARNEDPVGIGIEVGRGDLDAVVKEREQIVRYDAFEGFAVEEAEAQPETIEFGAAEEGFALGLEVVIKIADEINGANLGEGDFLVLAVLSEEIKRIELAEARGVEVAAQGLAVVQRDYDLFVGRGWGAEFQGTGPLWEMGDLHRVKLYDMLSAKILSTYCF